MTIRIAPTLTLPAEAVTETFAIIAKRRVGKSNAAVVIAEEMYDLGAPWVAIDPKGDWWGVRSSGDGRGPGLSVPIFGGRHGDIPLEPGAGAYMAELVAEQRLTCVLDVSEFSKADEIRFLLPFAERLLKVNEAPLHLFLEECDDYIPQQVMADETRLVRAFSKLVRHGGFKGIGCTLVTQRPALVNKSVLSQTETMILLRTIAPQDRDAVRGWLQHHADGADVLASLPSLQPGEAWVVSPAFLDTTTRVQFRRRRTFDSGSTPKVGEATAIPTRLADVDLGAIKEAMAETIERAKADDPKELRRRIKELEKQLADRPAAEPTVIEVPVVDEVVLGQVDDIVSAWANRLASAISRARDEAVETIKEQLRDRADVPRTGPAGDGARALERPRPAQRPDPPVGRERRRAAVPGPAAPEVLNTPRQRILDALAWYAAVGVSPASRSHVALVAGTSPTSSGYEKNLSTLRTAGLIDYPAPGMLALTAEGEGVANPGAEIGTTDELVDVLESRLGRPKGRILRALVAAHPSSLSRDELADAVEVSAQSSGFEKNLGGLRSLGFVDYPSRGFVVATEALFIGGGA